MSKKVKKITIWVNIKFWLMLKKLQFICWRIDVKNARARKKYCRRGYHHLKTGHREFGIDGKTTRFDYLSCSHCNWRFFATKRQKDKYDAMSEAFDHSTKEGFSALLKSFSGAKPKSIKRSGKLKGRESSVSVSDR